MYALHDGVVCSGFQFASGQAAARSPFGPGTLKLQDPAFRARGLDLAAEVPDLFWGTINIALGSELELAKPDVELDLVDWTGPGSGSHISIPPETFCFIRCCLAVDGRFHAGLIYYPHPKTKPSTNAHNYRVLEVLTHRVEGLTLGMPASVMCRADAFGLRAV